MVTCRSQLPHAKSMEVVTDAADDEDDLNGLDDLDDEDEDEDLEDEDLEEEQAPIRGRVRATLKVGPADIATASWAAGRSLFSVEERGRTRLGRSSLIVREP